MTLSPQERNSADYQPEEGSVSSRVIPGPTGFPLWGCPEWLHRSADPRGRIRVRWMRQGPESSGLGSVLIKDVDTLFIMVVSALILVIQNIALKYYLS